MFSAMEQEIASIKTELNNEKNATKRCKQVIAELKETHALEISLLHKQINDLRNNEGATQLQDVKAPEEWLPIV